MSGYNEQFLIWFIHGSLDPLETPANEANIIVNSDY